MVSLNSADDAPSVALLRDFRKWNFPNGAPEKRIRTYFENRTSSEQHVVNRPHAVRWMVSHLLTNAAWHRFEATVCRTRQQASRFPSLELEQSSIIIASSEPRCHNRRLLLLLLVMDLTERRLRSTEACEGHSSACVKIIIKKRSRDSSHSFDGNFIPIDQSAASYAVYDFRMVRKSSINACIKSACSTDLLVLHCISNRMHGKKSSKACMLARL